MRNTWDELEWGYSSFNRQLIEVLLRALITLGINLSEKKQF